MLAAHSSGGNNLRGRRIAGPMADDFDTAIDLSDPYMLKPLFLTELAFAEPDDSDESEEEEPQQPFPRSGHRIVCIDSNVYAFGGYNPDIMHERNRLFRELWKFDLNSYRWSQVLGPSDPGMPEELASPTMCASGKYILIYGGSGLPFGDSNSNRLHICDLTQQPPTMREIETTGEKPVAMYGQAMIIKDEYLYVIGGTSGLDYACDVHRLDLQTRTWEMVGPARPNERSGDPAGRYRHELAVDEEHILVIGGGTTAVTYGLDTLPAFHLPSSKWVEYKTNPDPRTGEYPSARKFHSLVQLPNGQVFIAGGCSDTASLRDIWRLDISTRTWAKLEKCRLPYRMYFHDAAVTPDGCMFIFGGVRERSVPSRTNNLYKLWLQVPPLKSISAEAVRYWLRVDDEDEDPKSVAANFKALPSHCRQYLL